MIRRAIAASSIAAALFIAATPVHADVVRPGMNRSTKICPYVWVGGTYREVCVPLPTGLPRVPLPF